MKQRYLAWLLLIAGTVWCRAEYLEEIFYNIDEAEYAVAAKAMNHGWLPGVDLLGCTKPPGMAALFNLLFHIFGQSLAMLHVAHIVIMIGIGFAVVELAIALWGKSAAIPSALLFWMVANTYELPSETLALNVESPAMLFAVPALLLAWTRPKARWALITAGVALGVGMLFRQSILLFAIPVAVAVSIDSERRLSRLLHVAAGMLLAWLPILVIYTAAGAMGWAWDSWVRYPITYSGDGGMGAFFGALDAYGSEFLVQATVPLALLITGVFVEWRERKTPRGRFLLWLMIASIAALCTGSRFFPHYWIQLYPAAALLGVAAWNRYSSGSVAMRRLLTAAAVIGTVVAALHFPAWRTWDSEAVPRGYGHYALGWEQTEVKLGHYVQSHTKPDETVAVWGYCPQIYYYADRLPGTRDYLCHYTTGYSPGTFEPLLEKAPRPYGHPLAQQMFVADLEKRKPKYIFDLVQIKDYAFPFYNYSLREYPQIADYVRRNYVPDGQIDEALIYRRRTADDTWQPDDSGGK